MSGDPVTCFLSLVRPRVEDRLGMFVTAVGGGYYGRWRVLEATVLP